MLVRDILQRKGTEVVTIESGRTVHDAIGVLNEHGIGALLVRDEDGEIRGILTERDVLHECGERCVRLIRPGAHAEADPCPSLVRDVMTTELIIGVPDDTVEYVMGVMTKNRIRHLPILEEGELAGIISIGDIVNALLRESEFENRMLKDYIQGAGT